MYRSLSLAVALLVSGCASTTYTLTGVPIGNQVVTMDRGTATVQSAWQGSTIIVRPVSSDLKGEIGLFVTLRNTSQTAGNFGTENVAISDDGHTWIPVKTYEQLKDKLDNQAAWQKFGAALLGSLDMAAASQAGNYSENGYVTTPYGSASYTVTGVDRDEQWAAMNVAAARSNDVMHSIDAQHAAKVAQLDALALRTTTVASGASFGGLVVADAPELDRDHATPILVRVRFLGDSHIVEFQAHSPGGYTPTAIADPSVASAVNAEAARDIAPSAAPAAQSDERDNTQTQPAAETPASVVPVSGAQRYDAWLKQHGEQSQSDTDQ